MVTDVDMKRGTPVRVVLEGQMVARPSERTGVARVSVTLADGSKFWCVVPAEMIEAL